LLLFLIPVFRAIARRIRIPYPILITLAGVAIAGPAAVHNPFSTPNLVKPQIAQLTHSKANPNRYEFCSIGYN
jgi:hypothetical protein